MPESLGGVGVKSPSGDDDSLVSLIYSWKRGYLESLNPRVSSIINSSSDVGCLRNTKCDRNDTNNNLIRVYMYKYDDTTMMMTR